MIEFADVGKESLPKCILLSRDISKFENFPTRKKRRTLSFTGRSGEKCYFSFPKQKQLLTIGGFMAVQDIGLYTWSGMPNKDLHKSDSQGTIL